MSEMNEMSCAMLADVAAELALGVLTGRERADAIEHLDRCETCREDVRKLMATGDELLGLLPPAEPRPGFETRVLDRLGLLAPGLPAPSFPGRAVTIPMVADRGLADRRPSGHRRPPRRSGWTTSRPRQLLAAAAVAIAIAGAGIGGWGMRVATTPAGAIAGASLSSATLMSTSHQRVGHVWASNSDGGLVIMSVDLEHGDELVTCQVIGSDGKVVDLGSDVLDHGYGSWYFALRGQSGSLSGARVVAQDGTVLATATF